MPHRRPCLAAGLALLLPTLATARPPAWLKTLGQEVKAAALGGEAAKDRGDLAARLERAAAYSPADVAEKVRAAAAALSAGEARAAAAAWPSAYPAVTVQPLGAARMVTGSMHLVRAPGANILVDAGMAQGNPEKAEALNRREFSFDPAEIDLLLITHGHIDHMGLLPRLVKEGFRGEILTTPVTAELMEISLGDSARLQFNKAGEDLGFNLWNRRERERLTEADVDRIRARVLYDERHLQATFAQLRRVEYEVLDQPLQGVRVRFNEAGHLPGSAAIEVWVQGAQGAEHKLVFGGDTGNIPYPLLKRPDVIEGADVLFLESTYGNRHHKAVDLEDRFQKFAQTVREAVADGGHVLMPAFAIGRSQVILSWLARMKEEGTLDRDQPIVLDSRMAGETLKVLRRFPESLDPAQTGHLMDEKGRFFWIPGFKLGMRRGQKLRPNSIVVASSGMLSGGKAIYYAQELAGDPKNDFVFSGYAAPRSPARKVMDGEPRVRIGKRDVEIHCGVHKLSGFSGHADQQMLVDYVAAFTPRPKHVVLVHGEPDAGEALKAKIEADLGIRTSFPAPGEVFVLE